MKEHKNYKTLKLKVGNMPIKAEYSKTKQSKLKKKDSTEKKKDSAQKPTISVLPAVVAAK